MIPELNPTTISSMLVGGGAVATAVRGARIVPEGCGGFKKRFGRPVRYWWGDRRGELKLTLPGFTASLPGPHKFDIRPVREQTIHCEDQLVTLANGMIYSVSCWIRFTIQIPNADQKEPYRIKKGSEEERCLRDSLYKALYDIDDLDHALKLASLGAAQELLSSKVPGQVRGDATTCAELLSKVKSTAANWGVTVLEFKLIDCAPVRESRALSQMQVAVDEVKTAVGKLADLPSSSHGLAAALVGTPVVATVDAQAVGSSTLNSNGYGSEQEASSLLRRLFQRR